LSCDRGMYGCADASKMLSRAPSFSTGTCTLTENPDGRAGWQSNQAADRESPGSNWGSLWGSPVCASLTMLNCSGAAVGFRLGTLIRCHNVRRCQSSSAPLCCAVGHGWPGTLSHNYKQLLSRSARHHREYKQQDRQAGSRVRGGTRVKVHGQGEAT
jgi:hypothetical protein